MKALGTGASARDTKKGLRSAALRRRRALDPKELAALSGRVQGNLAVLPEFKGASLVVSYAAKPDEVQTKGIIEGALRDGKKVAVVVTDPQSKTLRCSEIQSFEDLAPGTFGIPEPRRGKGRPVPIASADVILVPLVAWDMRGHRLGYGAGYFDRTLSNAGRATKVGLALECQRVPRIPDSRHDIALDVIVTEKRIVRPS